MERTSLISTLTFWFWYFNSNVFCLLFHFSLSPGLLFKRLPRIFMYLFFHFVLIVILFLSKVFDLSSICILIVFSVSSMILPLIPIWFLIVESTISTSRPISVWFLIALSAIIYLWI